MPSWHIDHGRWQDSQFRFANSSYLKSFHQGEKAGGLFELAFDDYQQMRIFQLSNRVSVNQIMFLAPGFDLIVVGFACRKMSFHGKVFFCKKEVEDACRLC